MADEDLTLGEIGRTLKRLERGQRDGDDRLAHVAEEMVPATLFATAMKGVTDSVATVRAEMVKGLEQVEKTSLERRAALMTKDKELGDRITGIETKLDEAPKVRISKAGLWVAGFVAVCTAIGLVVTLATMGGR